MAGREVVDLEKQRYEKENTPEGKKAKRMRTYLGIAAAIVFFSVLYVINHNPNAKKDMVVVTMQGIEIIPGKTEVSELLDNGFQLAEQQVGNIIDPEAEAEAKSYYPLIFIVKDNKAYGTITIANDASTAKAIPKCTILKIGIDYLDEGSDTAAADGTVMSELTYEDLVSKYGEPVKSEESEYVGGLNVEWENKGYHFIVNVGEDEKIHSVQSSYGRR